MVRFKPTVRRSTQSSLEQVRTTKKVRFADDLNPEQDRPTKKAKATQASIHQTIDGRIRKTDGGKTASSKDKRIRKSKVSHAIEKPLVDNSDSDDDMDVDANDEDTSDEETRGSPSPSRGLENESEVESDGEPEAKSEVKSEDESEGEPEGSDDRPQRGWTYKGLGRWTQTQEGEQEGTANANTDPSSTRPFTITVRHTDGTDHDFYVWGNTLQESSRFFRTARSGRWTSADTATLVKEDVNMFEQFLHATHDWEEFEGEISEAVATLKPLPTDDDEEVSPEKCREREQMFDTLIGVYILADRHQDLAGANRVMDQIIRFSHETELLPHLEAINQAYEWSLEDSPLRKLLRDMFVHESSPGFLDAVVRKDVDPDFTADVAVEYCRLRHENFNGHINKWFNDIPADRLGDYHQELLEPTPEERGVELTGNFIQVVRAVKSTETADQGSQGGKRISKASKALLQAFEE